MDFFGNNFKDMNSSDILDNLNLLNSELRNRGISGEVNLVGGAVMCLVHKSRVSTHDIDGIFVPKSEMYEAIRKVSNDNNLPEDWFNDAVKGFLSDKAEFELYREMSNLKIYVASPEYLLAMKMLSSRVDNINEINDIRFLLKELNIRTVAQCESIITKYYDERLILPKSIYLVEELLGELWG